MRIEQLTFTRFLGALIIVTGHFGQPFIYHHFGNVKFIFNELVGIVSYFHLMSGFILMIAYGNTQKDRPFDKRRFFVSRFARAYPLYFISVFMMLALFLYLKSPINYTSLPINLMLLQTWVPGHVKTFNVVGWSLSVEMIFYISFPILLSKVFKKFNFLQIAAFAVFLWSLTQFVSNLFIQHLPLIKSLGIDKEIGFYNPLVHLHEFVLGNLAGAIFMKSHQHLKGNDWALCLLVLLVIGLFLFPIYGTYHNGFLCIIFAPLILLQACSKGPITSFFQNKTISILGESSFALFILQIPCYMACRIILPAFGINGEVELFLPYMAILFISSIGAYLYIENPLRDLAKKLLKG